MTILVHKELLQKVVDPSAAPASGISVHTPEYLFEAEPSYRAAMRALEHKQD